ncbi:hypothetical protein QR680_016723 [Steinernema hermaphroditum]|uniref:Major facilitator superfamily (MFS) profile domain-containing protein n=1 Tax=Steinernema hermaphroditum TaxID=289476 RepID=A0AA39LN40_9BILA|nr:hypothetical protein QR680_016723 [Steinernema hermaphroditum]
MSSHRVVTQNVTKRPPLFALRSIRLRITLLLAFAKMCALAMRANLGMTIVCMVNSTTVESARDSSEEDTLSENPFGYNGSLEWDASLQGLMFSATSLGALLVLLPSGLLADRCIPKTIVFSALMASAAITYLSPLIAENSPYGFVASRFAVGVANGFMMPSLTSLAARWFVPDERSTLNAIFTLGHQLGGVLLGLSAPPLCSSHLLGGWPLVYYVYATVTVGWGVAWMVFGSNCAEESRLIGPEELKYIVQNMDRERTDKKVFTGQRIEITFEIQALFPWRRALASPAVLAVLLVRVSLTAQQQIMTFYTASFARDGHSKPLQNGLITSLPYFAQIVAKIPISGLADFLKRRRVISHSVSVRIFQAASNFGSAFCFFGLGLFADNHRVALAAALLTLHGICGSLISPGMHTSALSIAPAYSGGLYALTMFVALIASSAAPGLVASVLQENSRSAWSLIFLVMAVINVVVAIFFAIFGSAEVEEWAKVTDSAPTKRPMCAVIA